jgi:hypothetical protein
LIYLLYFNCCLWFDLLFLIVMVYLFYFLFIYFYCLTFIFAPFCFYVYMRFFRSRNKEDATASLLLNGGASSNLALQISSCSPAKGYVHSHLTCLRLHVEAKMIVRPSLTPHCESSWKGETTLAWLCLLYYAGWFLSVWLTNRSQAISYIHGVMVRNNLLMRRFHRGHPNYVLMELYELT